MIMKRIMEQIPQLEVWARIVAGYMTGIKEIYKKNNVKKKKHIGNAPQVHKNVLIDYLKALKIQKGDILIVHSSLRPLKCFGMAPTEIIEELLKLVGDEGTLVMPAFCKYNEHIKGKFAEESVTEFVYNVQESPAWTGVISDTFWRREDVIRSRYPDNPLAATGSCAREIFMQEAQGDLAHGRYSSWKFCSDKHAKVLFLGIPAFNSITEIHLAEDLLDDRWPVKGWFKECHYKIIDNEKVYNKTTRIQIGRASCRERVWLKV